MYCISLCVRVKDDHDELIDETIWALKREMRSPVNYWKQAGFGQTGEVFNTLTEVCRQHTTIKEALENPSTIKDPRVKYLWELMSNTRGSVKHAGGNRRVEFDLQIVSHQPTVLQTSYLDL
jgi:hypothetical protein